MLWWDLCGGCVCNCLFFLGEGVIVFWILVLVVLVLLVWWLFVYMVVVVFGVVISGLCMVFGGYFFIDVLIVGFVIFLVIWFGYVLIYCWLSM